MPAPELSHRLKRAVLWATDGGADVHGRPTVGAPVEVMVRWLTNRRKMLDPQGNTVTVDGTAVVGRAVEPGSVMWLGSLDSWYGVGSSGTDVGLCEVVAYQDTPDLKGRVSTRTVGLKRSRDSLPEVAT